MALIFSTTNITIAVTGGPTALAHGLTGTPDMVICTPRATTATGIATLIANGPTTITLGAAGAAGLYDVMAIKFHSIIQ